LLPFCASGIATLTVLCSNLHKPGPLFIGESLTVFSKRQQRRIGFRVFTDQKIGQIIISSFLFSYVTSQTIDAVLADYLLRLGSLCLTADPYQALFYFFGRGRNGKSAFVNVLTDVLGDFAWQLRPSEITVNRNGDEGEKRTYWNLRGKRLVVGGEAVGQRLNYSMLKKMSGGEPLTGASMRQNAVLINPTWKIVLVTNEKPDIPADPAFKGRVHMIPFRVSFLGREDPDLPQKLKAEYPGIVYKLLRMCPDVLANRLRPPTSVLAETRELFDELDVTGQFVRECLVVGDGFVSRAEMEQAIVAWQSKNQLPDCRDKILSELRAHSSGVKSGRAGKAGTRGYDRVRLTG